MLKKLFVFLLWLLLAGVVVFYPIMISMYVFLPLFIGLSGYIIIWAIDGHGIRYIWLPLIYLFNLEANLSLPIFLSLFSVLLFYLTLYDKVRYLKRCPICVGMLSVVLIDLYYFFILVGFDFLFDTHSIFVNELLIYTLVFDLIFVVLL